MNETHNPLRTIFAEALEIADAAQMDAYLSRACGADQALRREVEDLLKANAATGPFLPEQPAAAAGRSVLAEAAAILRADGPIHPSGVRGDKPGDRIGRYKLLQQIGEGGMGVVYLAEQEEPIRRRVALKVIKLGMDTEQVVARFEAERQALALMDHPNIARVLDAGATETGRPYFVMELVKGIHITTYCDQEDLDLECRLDLFIKVCQAIQHAHQKGIIHRDIKPSNTLVALHDGAPVPKVIDFGIAKATQQELTGRTLYTPNAGMIGSPVYMSPEQAEMSGLDIDTRSDIYSLGVLLYELLTGTTPFDAKELVASGLDAMRKTIREQEPPTPSTRLSEKLAAAAVKKGTSEAAETSAASRQRRQGQLQQIKGDLDWIVMKCLEKERSRRYQTANGLASDLRRHLDNEPVRARPPSKAYRLQKAWQRNKLVYAAAAAVAAALVVGIGISSWQAMEAGRARNSEKEQRLAAQTERDKAQAAEKIEEQARLRADHLLYVANMNLAQQAWEQNNVSRVRQLLKDIATYPERGFEWYYWQRQTHLELSTLRGHIADIWSVVYSPDGQWIATGSRDGTTKVWEAASGRELVTLKGHRASIYSVAFSPDGGRIVTGSDDQTAKVWETASGRELVTLNGHSSGIDAVAYSPDGQRIVTGSGDYTAKVWEAASGRELLTLQGHSARIWSVAYSPDGQRIVTGSADRTAKVWEAASGQELFMLKGHGDLIRSVAYSPDGQRIITGGADEVAKVWDAASGHELFPLKGHHAPINSVAFSRDGRQIITGSSDQTAKLWEAATGREVLTLKGHNAGISSVALSPDGQRMVTGSFDHAAKVWEVAGSRELLSLNKHSAEVSTVAFSTDGQRIITGSYDGTAKMWAAGGGKELLTLRGHSAGISCVALSPDGQWIVTGSFDQTAKVWEAASGRELLTLYGHKDRIRSVAFSPDGRRIVTGSFDQTAKVWEAASGQELITLKGHRDRIKSVAFSPDGQHIVTGSADETAKIWEAASGAELFTLKRHGGAVDSVAFSPDGQRLVTGSSDQTAKVWEAATGRELLTLTGHGAGVSAVAFSPDGHRIITGSLDRTAKVWATASGKELLTLRGHGAGISSVAFSPDGHRIVTGSGDQTAKVWEAATVQQVAAWQEEERAAGQYLLTLERERTAERERQRIARARESIKQWLILAPIALATGRSCVNGLDVEQIEGEGQLRPRPGETRSIGGGEFKWREVISEDSIIDFNAISGRLQSRSVAYAVCFIRSKSQYHGLQMLVSCDDVAKVYLNGKLVQKCAFSRLDPALEDMVSDVSLHAGLNVLVFKVVNEEGEWNGSVRFADAQGNPVKGIQVTLDPEAKD